MNALETWRVASVIAVIVGVIAYAVLSGVWVSTDAGWYQSLTKPSWQPPPWVFGVIWPYNFVALAAVGSLIAWRAPRESVCALAWAYLFYVPHSLTGAAIALSAAALTTAPIVVIGFQTSWLFGALLMPYQIWVMLAASLSWGYLSLNS
jgi:tryptophan-rich sensory protein